MSWNRFWWYSQMSGYEIEGRANWILERHPEYEPIEVTVRQGICSSWWGKSWCQNLERYADWSNRLERGKKYVRSGAVIDLKINGGEITARVIGSTSTPYKVNISIEPLSKERQREIEKLASGKIQNLEELVSGNFPEELKDAFFKKGLLFPEPNEIDFECSCPDSAYMCKHIAAVLYGIGVRLDSEPLLFFQMRGINTDKFMSNVLGNKVEKMLAKVEDMKSSRLIEQEDLMEMFGADMSDLPEIIDEPEDEDENISEEEYGEEDEYEDEDEEDSELNELMECEHEDKSVMNLPQFLKRVDKELASISYEDLKVFAHEIARTYPEDSRERFLQLLTSKSKPKKNDSLDALNRIRKAFNEINDGERCLDSDYDPEAYDHYYDDDDSDDYRFYDSDELLPEIEFAMNFVSSCIYSENYKDGYEVVKMLAELEIQVNGAYDEIYEEGLSFSDLFDYHILKSSFDDFMNEAIFLAYVNNELSDRPQAIYSMIKEFDYEKLKFENVMQVGNKDLPEIEEFIPLWCEYLVAQKKDVYDSVKPFLLNAYSLLDNEEKKVQLASKFAKQYPELYKNLLEESLSDNSHKLLIGLRALVEIPVSSSKSSTSYTDYTGSPRFVRSDIALLTAEFALKNQDHKTLKLCWFEAFNSEPTFVNYMRLRFNADTWTKDDSDSITKICKGNLSSLKPDYISERDIQKDYRGILFFEEDFDFVIKDCMKVQQALKWTSTFMKEGLALFLLLLFDGSKLSKSLVAMTDTLTKSLGFTTEKYVISTGLKDKRIAADLFWELFQTWKKKLNIPDKKREEWLKWLEDRINFRAVGLLEAKRYNRYSECAAFISALGDVKASMGDKNFKIRMMRHYKDEYPTRKAFHRALDAYR